MPAGDQAQFRAWGHDLAATLDELAVKANPKQYVDQGKDAVRARLSDPRVKYALIGVGVLVGVLVVRKLFR